MSTRATLTGNAPPWAKSSNFKAPASNADWVGVRVYLDWQNPDEAASLAAAVSDPSSAQYGQFLTPQQFRQRFAPAQASVQAVQQWLTSQGFNVVYTPQNNLYVSAEGTVAQASAALGVSFATYAVEGLTLRAPTSDPSVPASLGGIVSSVVGLDQTAQLVHLHIAKDPDAPPTPGFRNAQPCGAYWGEKLATNLPNPYGGGALPFAPCGYTPASPATTARARPWRSSTPTPRLPFNRTWTSGRRTEAFHRRRLHRWSHPEPTIIPRRA